MTTTLTIDLIPPGSKIHFEQKGNWPYRYRVTVRDPRGRFIKRTGWQPQVPTLFWSER